MTEPLPSPSYANPPVVEVVLSVQFDPIADLGIQHAGMLWECYRSRLSQFEVQPSLQPAFESFPFLPDDRIHVNIELQNTLPVRLWFVDKMGSELVQFQRDRFVFNWRRANKELDYPRFGKVRESFVEYFKILQAFMSEENLGELHPNQCEVTYVNLIEKNSWLQSRSELSKLLAGCDFKYTDNYLPQAEDVKLSAKYIFQSEDKTPLGRLYIDTEPFYRADNEEIMYIMRLTARGKPTEQGLDGVLGLFDLGHNWIVRGFTSITTPEMHKIWGRTQ